MFIKLAKHRQFEYTPHYYNPEPDEKLKQRLRIKRSRQRAKTGSLVWMIAAVGFILFMMYLLSQLAKL